MAYPGILGEGKPIAFETETENRFSKYHKNSSPSNHEGLGRPQDDPALLCYLPAYFGTMVTWLYLELTYLKLSYCTSYLWSV